MRDIFIGLFVTALGAFLTLYGGDTDIPAVELDKLGLVLLAIGGLDLLYGIFRIATRSRRRPT